MKQFTKSEVKLLSRIKQYLPIECLVDIRVLAEDFSIDNNTKKEVIVDILNRYGVEFRSVGPGTNRFAIQVGEYIFKIAMDVDGRTDNKREFIYSRPLQPYVIMGYEITPDGLFGTFEYVRTFDESDINTINIIQMKKILKEISRSFLIGDISIDSKNYCNWGYRKDGTIVILDFAYIYNLTFTVFRCSKCGSFVDYDTETYKYLKCTSCGEVYTFWDVRKKVTRKMEEAEIGDIYERGYNVTQETQIVKIDPRFSEIPDSEKKKTEEEVPEEFRKKKSPFNKIYDDPDVQPSLEDSIKMYYEFLEGGIGNEQERQENEVIL